MTRRESCGHVRPCLDPNWASAVYSALRLNEKVERCEAQSASDFVLGYRRVCRWHTVGPRQDPSGYPQPLAPTQVAPLGQMGFGLANPRPLPWAITVCAFGTRPSHATERFRATARTGFTLAMHRAIAGCAVGTRPGNATGCFRPWDAQFRTPGGPVTHKCVVNKPKRPNGAKIATGNALRATEFPSGLRYPKGYSAHPPPGP